MTPISYDFEIFDMVLLDIQYPYTVESVIEVGLVFNFWILGADFYSSFYQFLLNKCLYFHEFLRLLFESVFFSSQTTITDCTVYDAMDFLLKTT